LFGQLLCSENVITVAKRFTVAFSSFIFLHFFLPYGVGQKAAPLTLLGEISAKRWPKTVKAVAFLFVCQALC